MSTLKIRALRCVEETDEWGPDDVYMGLFRGSFTLPPDLKVVGGKGTKWANMSSGDLRIEDMTLETNYHPENVYVATLIEQDSGKDLAEGANWAGALEYWANHWAQLAGSPILASAAWLALLLGGGVENDEVLGAQAIAPIFKTGGIGQLLEYQGDGGYYRARAVLRA